MHNETELLTALKSKDRDAFNCLYNLYAQPLYEVIQRLTPDEAVAYAILEASFVAAWKNMDTYNSRKGSVFAWMFRITIKESNNTLRISQLALRSLLNYERGSALPL